MTNHAESENGSRGIVVKTMDGTVYTTKSARKISVDDMAYAMLSAPMMVVTNQQTGEKELVMTASVSSFTFEGGLSEEDVKSLTTPDENEEDQQRDLDNFNINGGKWEVH